METRLVAAACESGSEWPDVIEFARLDRDTPGIAAARKARFATECVECVGVIVSTAGK